jgi:hypothetical protein
VRGDTCDERSKQFIQAATTFFGGSIRQSENSFDQALSSDRFWGHTGEEESPFLKSEGAIHETCPLFARKFWPAAALELDTWFLPCTHIGLHAQCLKLIGH